MKDYPSQAKQEVILLWRKNPDQSIAHLLPHIEDVLENIDFLVPRVKRIGTMIDLEALRLAAIGHNIVQPYNKDKAEHIANSMKEFVKILHRIRYPEHKIQKVLQIISEHSSEVIKRPSSPEAVILCIADKWTGIGQKGKERVSAYCKQKGISETEANMWYIEKSEKAKPIFLELLKEMFGNDIPPEIMNDLNYTIEYLNGFKKKQKPSEQRWLIFNMAPHKYHTYQGFA